jgi:hypothetical protein
VNRLEGLFRRHVLVLGEGGYEAERGANGQAEDEVSGFLHTGEMVHDFASADYIGVFTQPAAQEQRNPSEDSA